MNGISRSRGWDKEIPHGVLPMEQLVLSDKWARKCYCLHPFVPYANMQLSPKPFDEIQPNLLCELLNGTCSSTFVLACGPHWGPVEGSKGQISLNFKNNLVNLKDFYTELCVYALTKKNIEDLT